MAWGYRLETLNARGGAERRQDGRGCSVGRCGNSPQFVSAYRYSRKTGRESGRAVTVSRILCVKHARLFSMKYSLAWPTMHRRARRPMASAWMQMAA